MTRELLGGERGQRWKRRSSTILGPKLRFNPRGQLAAEILMPSSADPHLTAGWIFPRGARPATLATDIREATGVTREFGMFSVPPVEHLPANA